MTGNIPSEKTRAKPVNIEQPSDQQTIQPPDAQQIQPRLPRHVPLLTIDVKIAGLTVKAIVDCGASAPIMGPRIAKRLGVWRKAHKLDIHQGDGSKLRGGRYVANTRFSTIVNTINTNTNTPNATEMKMFDLDVEVVNIGSRDLILGTSWLEENKLDVSMHERRLIHKDYCIMGDAYSIPTIALMTPDERIDLSTDIVLIIDASDKYVKYQQAFSAEQASRLPEHRSWDHQIPLKPGTKPPNGPIYKMTYEERLALERHLDEMMPPGKIQRSRSPASTPILFVKKKDGSLRLCVDYRGINNITIPNKYPLPLINDLLEQTKGAIWLTKLDLKNGYNLIRIAPGDEWKTAFKMPKGLFEYTVMPFGLTNTPASFQEMMDVIFADIEGVLWYLDDILIYGGTTEREHQEIVEKVLQKCVENGLAVNLPKSEFHKHEVIFLGHIINGNEIRMDPAKLDTIAKWPTPTKKKELQAFLEFANHYQHFISTYSEEHGEI